MTDKEYYDFQYKVAYNRILGFIIGLIICGMLTFLFSLVNCSGTDIKETTKTIRDTVRDTIVYYKPIPRDSVVVRYVKKVFPLESHELCDTCMNDSASVTIPITQKEYTDDSTYTAWVSGYDPSLDSIRIYTHLIRETVTQTLTRYEDSRFGVSASVGVGYGLISRKPDVYVGITFGYRLWPNKKRALR